jgi:uncharacterized protein YndB with AHSA1/START domain
VTVKVDVETRIGRPVADVFSALTAVERFPEWLIASGIVKVERLDKGPLTSGSRLRISQTVAGRSTVLDGVVSVLTKDAALGLKGRDPHGVTIQIDAALVPDDLGTTLRWSLRIGLPLRYRMFESMVEPQARRAAVLEHPVAQRQADTE